MVAYLLIKNYCSIIRNLTTIWNIEMTKNEMKAYVKSLMSKETKTLLNLVKKTIKEAKAVKAKPVKLVKKTRKSKKAKMEAAA